MLSEAALPLMFGPRQQAHSPWRPTFFDHKKFYLLSIHKWSFLALTALGAMI
jgi:hypothetical protein